MLVFLGIIPILVLLYAGLQRRRRRLAARLGGLGLAPAAAGRRLGARRHIPPGFFFTGLAILVVALARPQAVVNLPKVEGTVILAFDVSGSMAADDLKPTRMEAAKTAARDFIQRQPASVQIGVVAFSDGGFSVQTPTNEQKTILDAIDRLKPQRGTSVGQGIAASLNLIATQSNSAAGLPGNPAQAPAPSPTPVPKGSYPSAVIVLLTDGENNQAPAPLAAAQAAADRGVRIYTVGIGSPAGTTLHINGFTVHTQLDETLLRQIAQITGGAYFNAGNSQDLRAIYDRLDPQLVIKPEKTEVTSIFAGASILVLLAGGLLSLLWLGRAP